VLLCNAGNDGGVAVRATAAVRGRPRGPPSMSLRKPHLRLAKH
jgi:hypothetical protein